MEHSPKTRRQLKEAVEALEARRFDECHARLDGLDPELASVTALRGLAYAKAGALERGVEVLSAGLELHPKSRPLKLHLAALLEQLGAPEEALDLLEGGIRSGKLAGGGVGFAALYARCLLQVGRPERAEAVAHQALSSRPDDPDLLEIYARLLLQREAFEEALRWLRRAEELSLPTMRLHAEACLGAGRAEEAREGYRALALLLPEDPEILGGLAAALEACGEPLEAYGHALRATINAPEQAWLHQLHARLGLALGRFEAAMGAAASAVLLEPESPSALKLAMSIARSRGRYAEAAPFAQRLLRLEPEAPEARAVLALAACLQGDRRRAAELIGPPPQIDSPELLLAHGAARLLADDPRGATQALKRAARARLEDPLIEALLGVAYQEGDRLFALRAALRGPDAEPLPLDMPGPAVPKPGVDQIDTAQPLEPSLNATLHELLGQERPRSEVPSFSMGPEEEPFEQTSGIFDLGWGEEAEPPLEMMLDDEEPLDGDPFEALRRLLMEPLFVDLLGQLEHIKGRLDEPLCLALIGAEGAGRTTIVNALLGQEIVPLDTRWPHRIRYGRQPRARIALEGGESVKRPLTDLHKLSPDTPVRLIEILLPLEELGQANLIDLPAHIEDVGLLEEVDGCLWVVDSEQPLEAWARRPEFLSERPFIAVCNLKGTSPDLSKPLEAQIRTRLEGEARLVLLDARMALRALAERNSEALRASGLRQLRRGLERAFFSKAERLREASMLRHLGRIRAEAIARIEAHKAEVERRVDALAGLSISLQTRAHTSSEVWAELLRTVEAFHHGEERELMGRLISLRVSSRARLEEISRENVEALQGIFPTEVAPAEAARVQGLAALLESHKEMLLEQSFGRGEAYLRGFFTHRASVPPDLSHFLPRAAPLEAIIQRFVEEAITEQRLMLLKLEKKHEEPLRQGA